MLFSPPRDATHPLRASRLPSLCAVCRGWGWQRVCGDCLLRFASRVNRCARCAIPVPNGVAQCGQCLVEPPPFDRTLAAVDYTHPWDGLVTRFKFHAALDLAPVLAAQLLAAHTGSGLPAPALILPMPLSAERLRERGYNQAWVLARRLASAFRCRADASLLLRLKDSPHQLALAPGKRMANVRGVFAVEPRRRAELAGCAVTLIDDVMTTGATAAEASRALLQAGAARVEVWAVARTPRPGGD